MVKRSSSAFFFQTSIVSQIDNVDPLRLYKHYLKMYYLKEIFQAKTWLLSTNSIEIVD